MQEYMSAWTQLNQINFEIIKSNSVLKMSGTGGARTIRQAPLRAPKKN